MGWERLEYRERQRRVRRRRQVGVCLGNEQEVRNEVALSDRCVKCVWRKNEVHKDDCVQFRCNYILKGMYIPKFTVALISIVMLVWII